MTDERLVTRRGDSFRYVVWGLVSVYFVYVVIVVIAGLTGVSKYSGGKFFSLLFFPVLFLCFAGFISYWVIVRRNSEYVGSSGVELSFEGALDIMKSKARSLAGVEVTLDVYGATFGDGHYGGEPTTHISHALFGAGVGNKGKRWLVMMQNGNTRSIQFESYASSTLMWGSFKRDFDRLISRLVVKPLDVESTTVTHFDPVSGGSRVIKHNRPVVRVPSPLSNEEFVDKKVPVEGGVSNE